MFQNLFKPQSIRLNTAIAELESEWLPSARRASLVRLIEKYILPNPRIKIDSALCLGLGRSRKGFFQRLRFLYASSNDKNDETAENLKIWDCEYNTLFEDDSEGEGNINRDRILIVQNRPLYQLLLFETVLECLRSKFDIPHSLIQDPAFTAAERAFLTGRGHAVIPYPSHLFGKGHSSPLDPALLPRISHKTFFFAPCLDIDVGVDVLLAAKPSLHWGHDVCLDIGYPYFLNPLSRGYPLADAYAALASSYGFLNAPICHRSNPRAGFMYPVDPSDLKAVAKVQQRMEEGIADADANRIWILRIVEENRAREERGKRKKSTSRWRKRT